MEADSGSNPAPISRGAVLVVDDEDQVRQLTRTILEAAGHPVFTAADGDEALTIFQERGMEIHAVLLDVGMPGMDAAALLERIQTSRPETRVVVCSGHTDAEAAGRLGGRQPAGFLKKPYAPSELLARLKELW